MKQAIVFVCGVLSALAPALASASPRAIAVLDTEARWVRAINAGDAATIGHILAPAFVHITYRGAIQYREAALEAAKQRKPYKQRISGETVDFAGDAAIVHGVNTVTQGGRVVLKLRYTDVFANKDGRWKAISAQETAIAPASP